MTRWAIVAAALALSGCIVVVKPRAEVPQPAAAPQMQNPCAVITCRAQGRHPVDRMNPAAGLDWLIGTAATLLLLTVIIVEHVTP